MFQGIWPVENAALDGNGIETALAQQIGRADTALPGPAINQVMLSLVQFMQGMSQEQMQLNE